MLKLYFFWIRFFVFVTFVSVRFMLLFSGVVISIALRGIIGCVFSYSFGFNFTVSFRFKFFYIIFYSIAEYIMERDNKSNFFNITFFYL